MLDSLNSQIGEASESLREESTHLRFLERCLQRSDGSERAEVESEIAKQREKMREVEKKIMRLQVEISDEINAQEQAKAAEALLQPLTAEDLEPGMFDRELEMEIRRAESQLDAALLAAGVTDPSLLPRNELRDRVEEFLRSDIWPLPSRDLEPPTSASSPASNASQDPQAFDFDNEEAPVDYVLRFSEVLRRPVGVSEAIEVQVSNQMIIREAEMARAPFTGPTGPVRALIPSDLSGEPVIRFLKPELEISKYEAQDGEKEACRICLGEFEVEEEVARTRCNHLFHSDCVRPWVADNDFCPYCRTSLLE